MTAGKQKGAACWDGGRLRLAVRVQPRASRNEIQGVKDGKLRIRTTAAPTDGKANKAVIKLLAGYLGVAPSRINLVHGMTQRNKTFVVEGPVELPDEL